MAIDPALGRFKLAEGDDDPLQLVGSTWTGFGVPGSGFIKIQGDYAVMPAGEGDFQVLDISNRTNPEVVGHLRVDFNWVAAVYGSYAYISQGRSNNGLSAIDISDPTNPQWAGTQLWPHYAHAIEILDGLAYITTGFEPGFHILDLTDPLNPVEIGSAHVGDPEGANWLFLAGDRAYVGLATANGLVDTSIAYGPKSAGFSVIDISDVSNPTLLGTYLGEPDQTQTGGLLAFYPFEGNANDLSGNELHGIVYGPEATSGYEGNAYAFDGQDDYIWAPVDINPATHPKLTFGAWVNPTSLPGRNESPPIISNGGRALHLDNRWCGTPNIWCANVPPNPSLSGDTAVPGEWVFLAVVYDQEAETITLYVDEHVYHTTGTITDRYDSIRISGTYGWLWPFHGLIDNLFFFDAALDAQQIDTIRQGGAQAIIDLGDTLPVGPPEPLPPQKLPRLIGVSGDIAIMAQTWIAPNYPLSQPAKLILVDASNPGNLHKTGSFTFQSDFVAEKRMDLYSSVASGPYIYIADDSQDSTQDSLNLCTTCPDDPQSPDYKYYYEDYTSLLTFDISDPSTPIMVDRYDHPQPSRFRHMTIYEDNLYVNDYNYGVRVFNLADPAQPNLTGGTVTAAEGHYGWVNDEGNTVFTSQTFGGTIYALDIQDPSAPSRQGVYWDGEWNEKRRFTGRGDYLYVPTGGGLNIITVSDPTQPVKSGMFPEVARMPDVSVFRDYAYVLTAESWIWGTQPRQFLHIYDICAPATPILMNPTAPVDFSARQIGVFAQGNYAYVISPNNLTIVDVHNPTQPVIVGQLTDARLTIADNNYPMPMQVKDGYAYIVTGERNERFFHIVDVVDPSNPIYIDTFTHSNRQHVTDIIISGKYLYLGIYWGTFWVFDLTNPVAPVLVANAQDLDLDGWEASWSLGGLVGEYLAVPALSRFHLVDVPRDNEGLIGPVTVVANIITNQPPMADAGGVYLVPEGETIPLNGAGIDPDDDPLTFAWDLDNDGVFEALGQDATFATSGRDGPDNQLIVLQVCDDRAACATDATTVEIYNMSPTITGATNAGPIQAGNDASITIEASDPAGINDPLKYSFDCDGDGQFEIGPQGRSSAACPFEEAGIFSVSALVADDDGGSTETSLTVVVTGNSVGEFYSIGYWKHQFNEKKKQHIDETTLTTYIEIIQMMSAVFNEQVPLSGVEDARAVLNLKKATMQEKATQHLLASWLNFTHGAASFHDLVDTDQDMIPDTLCAANLTQIETILLDPDATKADYEVAKNIAESINSQSETRIEETNEKNGNDKQNKRK